MIDVISTEQIQEFLKQRKERCWNSIRFWLLLEDDTFLYVSNQNDRSDCFSFLNEDKDIFELAEKYKLPKPKKDSLIRENFFFSDPINKDFINQCLDSLACIAETQKEYISDNSYLEKELIRRGV